MSAESKCLHKKGSYKETPPVFIGCLHPMLTGGYLFIRQYQPSAHASHLIQLAVLHQHRKIQPPTW